MQRSARSRAASLLAVGAAVVLAPVLLAGPAMADDVIIDEPPGGATCAPEIPATDCEQEPAPTPSPSKTAKPATIPVTGGSPSGSGTTGKPSSPTLANTGSTQTVVVGAAGAGLLVAGLGLVAAGRRRTA